VVDEAYFEYVTEPDYPDAIGWLGRYPNLIVARTFSKIYGLAGLRIGYGVADPALAGWLERGRHPFNVSRLAEIAARAALDDDAHVARSRAVNGDGAAYLSRELAALGLEVWPTDANFVLVRAGRTGVYEALLRDGVIVRPMAGFGLPDCIRITIGLPEENEKLVKALRRLREART
jgi:histidinol-phosphate aminotransferase